MDKVLLLQSSLDILKEQARRVLCHQIRGSKTMAQETDNPIEFLQEYPWKGLIPIDQEISQEEFRRLNATFDPRGYFGRTVLAVLLVETYFPNNSIQVAEVLEDELARRTFLRLRDEKDPQIRIELARELLMYEEPHTILVVNGVQFDPLSCLVGQIKHPRIIVHDPWPAIMASHIVSLTIDCVDLNARSIHLQRAQVFCPEMVLVKENMATTQIALDGHVGIGVLAEIAKIRPSARLFFTMWLESTRSDIFNQYPREVFDLLQQEYNSNLVLFEQLQSIRGAAV